MTAPNVQEKKHDTPRKKKGFQKRKQPPINDQMASKLSELFKLSQSNETKHVDHRQQVSTRGLLPLRQEAVDGVEGIRKAIELVPDIVISDLMMPGANGYEVCAALKNNEICAHIPVILLTARTALEARIKGLQAGADDYLGKPFNADELQARMHNLVAIRRRLLERFAGGSSPDTEQQQTDGWSDPDREFLRRFTHVIEQYLDNEAMGVEEFAGKMYVSRVQLHRKMKALTGKPASDFIRDYRLDRAMTLLRNREGNVAEVAARVGFVNEKYFSVVFKEKFGRSPSQID